MSSSDSSGSLNAVCFVVMLSCITVVATIHINIVTYNVLSMIIRKLFQDTSKRTVLTIPAFIRDYLCLKNGDEVTVEFDGDIIKVKPIEKDGE